MANNSVVTQEKLQNYHENLVYPYLNGATHTGCVPLGTILPYFGETAPTHFLICDGTEYAKSDYPELAEHLLALTDPTPYAGSDADHFKVPDLRGEFLRGTGTNSHTNQGSGANVGVHQDGTEHIRLTVDNLGAIYYSCPAPEDLTNSDYLNESGVSSDNRASYNGSSTKYTSQDQRNTFTSRPTNTSVTYIIAYRNAYIDLALDSFPIDISQPTDGQLLMYDATAGRWVNGGHKYSTDEHVVGKWIDGKPIYEKTFVEVLSEQWSVGSHLISAPILNFKRCHKYQAMYQGPASGSIAIPFGNSNSEYGAVYIGTIDGTNIQVRVGGSQYLSSGATVEVTIQYTKTTD